jgi:hypothetical protein
MKVFVLGESRTGTTSVHEYLCRSGLKAIHYYVAESGVTEPIHKHRASNWAKVQRFIDESGYDAFSDYPTRMFFRELGSLYPNACFILTVRQDVATWRSSMAVLLGERHDSLDLLQAYYLCFNEEIRCNCADLGLRFLEICIDDDAEQNARKIGGFLGVDAGGSLLRLNASAVHR